MKKVFSLVVVIGLLVAAGNTTVAQNKFAHVELEHVVSILPDVKKADTVLQNFRKDSLEQQLPFFLSEYKRKDSIAKSPATPAAIKQTVQQEANQYLQIIQNWDQYAQQEMQRKSQEVYGPYFSRAFELISTVAKENGYTWVFKQQEALLVAPPADDLLPLIAKKLGVKLPAGATTADKPAAEPAKPASGGAKKQ